MRISITCLSLLFLLSFGKLQAQFSKDATVALSANVSFAPASITLNWPNPAAANLLIKRRTKGQAGNQWIQILNQTNSTLTTFTDNSGIVLGQTYEYFIVRGTTFNAFGYAHVAVRSPVTDTRGKILVFVDSTTADAIGVELVRLKNDMRGDGWIATPYKVGPSATPASVKAQIIAAYAAEPQLVKSVLLIGDVPIPYSGAANWDGHPEHTGAWPADSYYAELNGMWTDASVDNDTSARLANRNIPGDGKFDQSIIPSAVELQVGRIDFRRINAPAFGEANAIGLVRRYLDKNHAWRTGAYTVDNKALVDDNFGFFGGEAFAANGFRNAYPLVGEANVVEADFFDNTSTQKWLLGYGCGAGNYQGANGIGSSSDFATDTVNIVFSNLFGSYFGDWDFESNPFMPSALASRGGILTCTWAGRPHWFNQAFASGETIGYCHKETQNAQFNTDYFGSTGESGAHTALLGDPTLRAHIVAPPTAFTVTGACVGVNLAWTASTETVDGYHVYRSLSNDGPYTRISSNLINGTTFLDNSPVLDTLFYQVRAIKTQVTPGGGIYLNNSVGPISYLVYTAGTPPTISVEGGTLTCIQPVLGLEVSSNTPIAAWAWEGPFGVTSTDTIFNISGAGNYKVVVTDINGCTAESTTFVDQNTIPPVFNIASTGILNCLNLTTTLSVNSTSPIDENSYQWSNGSTAATITVNQPQTYEVFVNGLDNGCPGSATFDVLQDIQLPDVDFPSMVTYNCFTPCISLALPNPADYSYYVNLELVAPGLPATFCTPGVYTITTVLNNNGCLIDSDVEVTADINEPGASIAGSGILTCLVPSLQLMGSSLTADVTYTWSGPGVNGVNMNQQNITISAPGTYTLTVRDNNNGCTSQETYVVASDGSIPVVTATGGTITCTVLSVTLTSTSNVAGSTFAWSGPGGFFSTEQNTLTSTPGSYSVLVSAPNGCTTSVAVEVLDQTQAPQFTIPSIPQLNCSNPCATIQIIPITPGLVIDPITVCDPGPVMVTITGSNGCTAQASFLVTEAPEFVVALDPPFIDCDGSVTISAVATGGTLPYSYLWSNGSTFSAALFILDGMPISVTVADASGCLWVSGSVVISVPLPLNIVANATAATGTQSNGSIALSLTGGTGPFGFQWSNGATTQDITGLAAGTYTVIVTELGTGCTTEASVTVLSTSVGTDEASWLRVFALSPNPSSGISILSITLDNQLPVKVEVRDVLGRLIIENPTLVTSDLTWTIDLTHQAPGVYNVSVIVDNQSFVRKLVVVK
jgi:hypothetical protein